MKFAIAQDGPGLRWVQWAFRLVIVGLAALHLAVAVAKQSMNEDGIAYLDLGDAWLRGDWQAAANTTWSPLYAVLVALPVNLVKPSIGWEFPTVQIANFLIFLVALLAFEFFWKRFGSARTSGHGDESTAASIGPIGWWTLGYSLFAWAALNLVELWAVTPDMLVLAIVLAVAGWIVSAERSASPWPWVVAGALLGVGYLAKAVMFPLGVALLVLVALSAPSVRAAAHSALPAAAAFAAISLPMATMISIQAGEPTFSDVGRFTYLKHVNGMPYPSFDSAPVPPAGTAMHPPRQIFDAPRVYEFSVPVGGTYPLGFDPAYWTRGLTPTVDARRQLNALLGNVGTYFDLLIRQQGGSLGVIVLMGVLAWRRGWRPDWRDRTTLLVAWAVTALALYALVRVEGRYVAPFVLLLLAGLLASIRWPERSNSRELATVATIVIALVQWTNVVAVNAGEAVRLAGLRPGLQDSEARVKVSGTPRRAVIEDNVAIARALLEAGVRPGDAVAVAGYSYSAYWARLARLRIVAEIRPGELEHWWSVPPQRRAEVLAGLRAMGVAAVVAEPPQQAPLPSALDWQDLAGTGYLVHYLLRGT